MIDNKIPKVSVVIPTYNRPDAAVHCAKSVLASNFTDGIEIVIVDDCSTKCIVADYLRKEIGEDSRIKVIRHERNKNLAAARNTGGRNSSGKYVFFLDDDNELQPDTIAKLSSVLDDGKYSIAAPLIVNVSPTGGKNVWASSFAFSRWMSIPRNVDADVDYDAEYERGMVGRIIDTWYSPNGYMMSRDLFDQMDGFYEWFGFCMEESDLCMRVREAGRKVCVVGDAVTWHRHYNDTGDLVMRKFAQSSPSKAFRLSRNRLHFAWRHYTLLQTLSIMFIFAPLVTVRYALMSVIRGWSKISLGFIAGYTVGFVQVLGLILMQGLLWPFAIVGKCFFAKENDGLHH